MIKPFLKVTSLCKSFNAPQGSVSIFADVNLEILPHEIVSIQGESGCGKTTLLNVLGGLEDRDAGSIDWDGEPMNPNDNHWNKRKAHFLGFVFQSYYLIPELNVLENVLIAHKIAKRFTDDEAQARAQDLLQRIGLSTKMTSLPNILSGGERQRVAIARALINHPKLILADEPTGNLDEHTAESVFECFMQIIKEENASMLLVTHSSTLANQAHRKFDLKEGTLHVKV